MTFGLKAAADGLSGTLQVGGVDKATLDNAGKLTVTKVVGDGSELTGLVKAGTAQATTSGTFKDFAIPAGTKRITLMLNGVSLSGTAIPLIQLGTAGGIEATGYKATTIFAGGSSIAATAGFPFGVSGGSAANTHQGQYILSNLDGNQWVGSGICCVADGNAGPVHAAGGKTLSGLCTTLRLTSNNGTDTFDLGSANILCE